MTIFDQILRHVYTIDKYICQDAPAYLAGYRKGLPSRRNGKHAGRLTQYRNNPTHERLLLRLSEVVAVNVEDLKEKTLTLRSSKSDQEGTGESLYVCDTTRDVLDRYRERADITDGAVFRHIRRGNHIQPTRLHPHSARRIIKKRAANAGVDGFISGHSLRV